MIHNKYTCNNKIISDFVTLVKEHALNRHDRVIFLINNSLMDIYLLCALLKYEVNSLLLSFDTPEPVINRITINFSVKAVLYIDNGVIKIKGFNKNYACSLSDNSTPAIYLLSSGSTGMPKIIKRSFNSLIREGNRYISGLDITKNDVIGIPIPVYHAYALGVCFAALVSGAKIRLCLPNHLSQITRFLCYDATIIILSTTLVSLLVKRDQGKSMELARKFRFAMVGAGPVSAELDRKFNKIYKIGLARNYGSTETGAIFAGLPHQPSYSVGKALPGVKFRIMNSKNSICLKNEVGLLEIYDDELGWHNMQDMVNVDDNDNLIIKGRMSSSIRRGDRWVSPFEIEEAARNLQFIKDAHVYTNDTEHPGHKQIIMDIVINSNVDVNYIKTQLYESLKKNLCQYQMPDKINYIKLIKRDINGKVTTAH